MQQDTYLQVPHNPRQLPVKSCLTALRCDRDQLTGTFQRACMQKTESCLTHTDVVTAAYVDKSSPVLLSPCLLPTIVLQHDDS